MNNWKLIDRAEVWSRLHDGKTVVGVVLEVGDNKLGIYRLRDKVVARVEDLLEDENAVFFEAVEEV